MLARIFPASFDNRYRGHWLGLALFVLVIAVKALQGVESMIQPEQTMVRADGIPLGSFGPVAAHEATVMFALLGMYLLVIPLLSLVALVRYRSMVPFMLLMLIAVQLGARGIHFLYPDAGANSSGHHPIGFYVNLGILAATAAAFVLSLLSPKPSGARP